MSRVDDIIGHLNLVAHPEGGYFKETYRSAEEIDSKQGKRNIATNIYFLLKSGEKSAFHRLRSDEFWYFHQGSPLEVFIIFKNGELKREILGSDCLDNQKPQLLLPKGTWFAARCLNEQSYTLISCSVSPGFDFDDFELAERSALQKEYPEFTDIIYEFT